MQRKLLLPSAAAAALAAVAFAWHGQALDVVAPVRADDAPATVGAQLGLPDFTGLVSRAAPAVVSIRVTQLRPTGLPGARGLDPRDPFYEFFRRFGPPGGPGGTPPVRQGAGSGFVISADGYILTNAHVVADADEVQVRLQDKRELEARVIGVDELSDVAVIKVEARDLPFLAPGDPGELDVGEWVIAIGSPFGLEQTVSAGVVSAKTRSLPSGGTVPFIQTDVAINPGNSGGPLLNLAGEVVGINSQIYSNSGGYMGVSFAIPIDVAMNVEHQLVEFGKVTRGRIGVVVQSVDQALARSFGLGEPRGALVSEVEPGGPAARAGLRSGDVILAIDGQAVEDSAALARLIAALEPGAKAGFELLRERREHSVEVVIGEAGAPAVAGADGAGGAEAGRLGVVVRALGTAGRRASDGAGGVLVEQAAGAAARAGIRPGDVILAVNTDPVSDPAELASLIGKAPEHVALLIQRNDDEIYVPVTLG